MRKISLLAFLIFILIGCANNSEKVDSYLGFDIPKDSLNNFLKNKMKDYNINGISFAMINDGKVVYTFRNGFANKELKIPVTEQTIFEGASISKSVFAFFVMTFVEDGTLNLDTPLYKYLPYEAIAYDKRYKKITARMVLSHRSGFQNWREDDKDKTLKIQFEPDTNYFYSGEGYQYLAKVLKHLLQTDWNGLEKEFQKRIAKPIGLQNTVFIQNEYTKGLKASPYDKNNKAIDWKNNYWSMKDDGVFSAPASIHSEALDFSKWMIALMKKEILSKESYKQLLKPHSKVPEEGIPISYTLGFVKPDLPFTNLYMHGGNNIGFTAYYGLDTNKDWGFVLFTNSEYGEQLGMDFLYYAAVGPNKTKLYSFVIFIILLTVAVLYFLLKKGIQFYKKR